MKKVATRAEYNFYFIQRDRVGWSRKHTEMTAQLFFFYNHVKKSYATEAVHNSNSR